MIFSLRFDDLHQSDGHHDQGGTSNASPFKYFWAFEALLKIFSDTLSKKESQFLKISAKIGQKLAKFIFSHFFGLFGKYFKKYNINHNIKKIIL